MIITVDFTGEEIAIIKDYAALHGVSVEEFIRQTVMARIKHDEKFRKGCIAGTEKANVDDTN